MYRLGGPLGKDYPLNSVAIGAPHQEFDLLLDRGARSVVKVTVNIPNSRASILLLACSQQRSATCRADCAQEASPIPVL